MDSLRLTEPGADPNPFRNGLTFSGWGKATWPRGATGATVTYTFAEGPPVTLEATGPNTLPGPPEGRQPVGFTVEFTGAIVPGAEADIEFVVTADAEQAAEEVKHPNTVLAESTAEGGYRGEDTANDTLTTIVDRLAVEVDKKISPSAMYSVLVAGRIDRPIGAERAVAATNVDCVTFTAVGRPSWGEMFLKMSMVKLTVLVVLAPVVPSVATMISDSTVGCALLKPPGLRLKSVAPLDTVWPRPAMVFD